MRSVKFTFSVPPERGETSSLLLKKGKTLHSRSKPFGPRRKKGRGKRED